MKTFSLMCITSVLSIASICNAQTWSLNYGKENGKVAFYNSKSDPNFAEDSPYGPMSFRVIGDKLWVLNSIAGKLDCFDKTGKLIKEIKVPELKGFILLEDFALAGKDLNNPEYVWIANAADFSIRKISLTNGKLISKIGGDEKEPGRILQVSQIEVDAGGRLYVADIAKNTLSVFSATGSFLREYPWQSSGFVVDKLANLHMLFYSENSGYFYRVYSQKGQLIKDTHLGFINNTNVKIISVNKDNSIILSLIPKEGFRGSLLLYKISQYGELKEKLEYIPPQTMNRDLFVDGEKIFLAEANFETAPSTKFIIKQITWDKKK